MPFQLPPNIGSLFQATQMPRPGGPAIVHRGSIISFHYMGQSEHPITDPYPLVLVSDIYTNVIRGLNLNYLTAPYVKSLINNFLDKNFSYAYIKGDTYLVGGDRKKGAFRTYKRSGISQLRMLDAAFLRGVAAVSRSLNPLEVEQMRAQIEALIKSQGPPQVQAGPGEFEV